MLLQIEKTCIVAFSTVNNIRETTHDTVKQQLRDYLEKVRKLKGEGRSRMDGWVNGRRRGGGGGGGGGGLLEGRWYEGKQERKGQMKG